MLPAFKPLPGHLHADLGHGILGGVGTHHCSKMPRRLARYVKVVQCLDVQIHHGRKFAQLRTELFQHFLKRDQLRRDPDVDIAFGQRHQ